MKNKYYIILFILFTTFLCFPTKNASASVVIKEGMISSSLTQWVLDEPTNTLYAISSDEKKLYFINSSTLSIEKSISFTGNPSDLLIDDGNLYVAIHNLHQIVVVDLSNKTISNRIYTSADPFRIVKEGNSIYYTTLDQWCEVHRYDLVTNLDTVLQLGSVYSPDLAINTSDHLLYIGESGLSGSDLIYYSTAENRVIGKTNYNNGYGFPYPKRITLFDGTNVYYAGRDFKSNDPSRFNGDFGKSLNVINVSKGIVFTNTDIFDKETHNKLGAYGSTVDLVEVSSHSIFLYNKTYGTVKKYNDSEILIDSNNIISLISGIPYSIDSTLESSYIGKSMELLPIQSVLTQWLLDENSNTLFGISKEDKALFFINAETLNLEKSLTFTSSPTDIIQDDGKLYIALDDANQIAIIDTSSRTKSGVLYTSSDPFRIVKDGNNIFYTERDQWCDIYQYNLMTNSDQKLVIETMYYPDLAINTVDHILYIGESGSSSSKLFYYSTSENRIIGKSSYNRGYGFPYAERHVLFDGQKVYFAGYSFDTQNPNVILGYYGGESIQFVKNGYAFSESYVYDSETYEMININEFDLTEISSQNVLFYYTEYGAIIIRIDTNKLAVVEFDSLGGNDVVPSLTEKDMLLEVPEEPTKSGYTFAGWYKEASCTNAWNFATDIVTDNTTLYAKWIAAPISVSYQGHVQNIGWQDYVSDGALAGTEGQSLRVEGFKIKLENAPEGLHIKYKTHVQNVGWQDWVYDDAMAGTQGQSLRVEALQIMLEGIDSEKYSVQYQAHVQNEGWQRWVKDGEISGSFGKSQRIEAIRIKITEKLPSVSYQGHVQNIGWQDFVKDGALAGTEGKSLRVEGFKIKLEDAPEGLHIKYKTHVQNIGWQDWVYDGEMAGTQGQSLRVEALQIMLEGTDAEKYSIQYQAHVQNEGWQPWVKDGEISGSFGKSQRIEALRIVIVKK